MRLIRDTNVAAAGRSTVGRCIRYGLVGPLMALSACSTLKPSPDGQQAQRNWNHMRARVKYQLAKQQSEAGLFDEAIETVSESLALDPTQPDAYAVLARTCLELGKSASAKDALAAAQNAGLASPELIYLQGVILEQRDQFEAALSKYAEASRLDPRNMDYLTAEAECLVAVDRGPEALALLDGSLEGVDDDGTVAALSGHIAAMMGDTAGAARRYDQAIALSGDNRVIAEELGMLLVRAGRFDQALSVLLPLLAGDQDRPPGAAVRRAVAACHLGLDDPASAQEVLSDYAGSHSTDVAAQFLLAKAAIRADDPATARRALDRAERREPDHPQVRLLRAVLQWRRGDLTAATATLEGILAGNPDDVEAHCLMAEVLSAGSRPEAARRHFWTALVIDPDCDWAIQGLRSPG